MTNIFDNVSADTMMEFNSVLEAMVSATETSAMTDVTPRDLADCIKDLTPYTSVFKMVDQKIASLQNQYARLTGTAYRQE